MPIETPTLRTFLRALQCRPSEVQRFRSAVVDLHRRRRDDTPPEELDLMARDMLSPRRCANDLLAWAALAPDGAAAGPRGEFVGLKA